MLKQVTSVAYMLLALCLFTTPTFAGDDEIWWSTAMNEAERDGYTLINGKELAELLDSNTDVLVIDARADYEFEAGRIPGSANLEFDLGDRMRLPDAKRAAFMEMAGPDKKRQLVIYCRSFR